VPSPVPGRARLIKKILETDLLLCKAPRQEVRNNQFLPVDRHLSAKRADVSPEKYFDGVIPFYPFGAL